MAELMNSVKALYSVMQSKEARLGGGEGVEGLYGSISKAGMQKILHSMRDHCGLDSQSQLVDVGAGLGRPLLHALLDPGIQGAFGVELDPVKCDKAKAFLAQTVAELKKRGAILGEISIPRIKCAPVEKVSSLEPATHAYSFWEGVPIPGKCGFGRLFASSQTLQAVTVVQRAVRHDPAEMMFHLGFGSLKLVTTFSVSMSGSGRSFRAYVFNRLHCPSLTKPLAALCLNSPSVVPTASPPASPTCVSAHTEPSDAQRSSLLSDTTAEAAEKLLASSCAVDTKADGPESTVVTQPHDSPSASHNQSSPSCEVHHDVPLAPSNNSASATPRRSNRLSKKAELARLNDKENKQQSCVEATSRSRKAAAHAEVKKSPAKQKKSPEGVQKLSPIKSVISGPLTAQIKFRQRRKPHAAKSLAAKMGADPARPAMALGLAGALKEAK